MQIIQNNPYRQLGVYANSPVKERVANHNRLKAFLKVGKSMEFPLDLACYLPPINRTSETVAQAEANLALPKEQLKYAQFWFLKVAPLDDVAFSHLYAGDMAGAVGIWKKRDNASSLQDRIVCALINGEYSDVMACAELLYARYVDQFVSIVMGDDSKLSSDALAYDFLDALCEELGADVLLPVVSNEDWHTHIKGKAVKPLMEKIQAAIDVAKSSKGGKDGCGARYNAGIKLMNVAEVLLQQLKSFLPATDLQYQMVADKIGLEILQCGIDYFNGSDEPNAARKAMALQSYALNVVVGRMAKDRCKENVDILQKIINNLPPAEVFAESKAVEDELRKFCQLADKICHAITLLNNTKPHLQSIKAKLGVGHPFYLRLSTKVVGNALHNVVEEVNAAQKEYSFDRDEKIRRIKAALRAAWEATTLMDTFDLECEFQKRYNQNRNILKDMCNQMGVSIGLWRTVAGPNRDASTQWTPSPSSSTDGNYSVALIVASIVIIAFIFAFIFVINFM